MRFVVEDLEPRILLTRLISVDPPANSHSAAVSANVVATFDQDINAGTATPQNFVLHSPSRPMATLSATGATITADPMSDFFPGELVEVTASPRIQSTTGSSVVPHVWQFRTSVARGTGVLVSSQSLEGASGEVALGDLDGDGDLDAFVTNFSQGKRVWLNNGDGAFSDTGQVLGNHNSRDVSLGDLDGDGDLDAFTANFEQGNRVWLNNGSGVFTDSGQSLGNHNSDGVALGDLDGDGDLDAFVANGGEQYHANRVWLNDGSGRFEQPRYSAMGNARSLGISLGDLDGDGDLDAFVTNFSGARVWLNNQGSYGIEFNDSGQSLGNTSGIAVALGDLDGDGDLDAFLANTNDPGDLPNHVWVNDGSAVFSDSGQLLGHDSTGVELGDLDGDGDLDAFVTRRQGNRVWLNNGDGAFSDTGQVLGDRRNSGVSLGDLDGDGDLDAFVAGSNQVVWLNQGPPMPITLSADAVTIPEAGGVATITATSAAAGIPITISLDVRGTATATVDYTVSDSEIVIPAGATTGSVSITAIDDTLDEPDETVIVDITGVAGGAEVGTQQVTITILDDDEPTVPDVTLSLDSTTIPEDSGVATFTVNLSEATTVPVTVDLDVSGTATLTADYTLSATRIVVAAGSTSGSVTVTAVQDTLEEPNETVIVDIANVGRGNESGSQQQTTMITDDDAPATPRVSSLSGTSSGFVGVFNSDLDTSTLNLYETQASGLGAADATLVGAISGPVSGSLVVDAAARSVTFIKSGDALVPDNYTVTLRSADNGFKRADGVLLDGDGDGTPGGDFTETFTVAPPGTNAVTVGLTDFVRGPGQEVNVPADATTGIPVLISEGANLRNAALQIDYDPRMLTITGATLGGAMPADATVALDTAIAGTAILTFTSPAALPAGSNILLYLQATVPIADASAIYGQQQVLDVHSVQLTDANANPIPAIDDDAVHLATYFADVSGNGRINASDASQVARFAALLETGFASSLLTDPMIIGDISGNGRINAADASLVARFAALIDVPEIPLIPGGTVIAGGGTPPGLRLGPDHSRGGTEIPAAPTEVSADEGVDIPPIHYPAVDAVMAGLASRGVRDLGLDDVESTWALDGVLDQLLSVLNQRELVDW